VTPFPLPWSLLLPYAYELPGCDELAPNAQPPFGLWDHWFENAVYNNDAHHPSRRNSDTPSQVIVSKCNFIDAAYAAADILSTSDIHNQLDCGTTDPDVFRDVLAAYHRGSELAMPDEVGQLQVDIAVHCR